jgi:anthranilate synthase component 2
MIVLIDNYDSFSYNLYQLIGKFDPSVKVVRNDCVTIEQVRSWKPTHIVLSPGPGKPADAGICEEVVRRLGAEIPILGVCLGHQAICESYGATVTYAKQMMHGKSSMAELSAQSRLFAGIKGPVQVARYHSLAVLKETLPPQLKISATAEDGEVMAVEHESDPVFGLQFHPESILTPDGAKIIENFLKITV